MTSPQPPEVWLRGPIDGFDALVMPAVHALLQVREDLHALGNTVPESQVWQRPGGAASIGFHLRHTGGALDRLLTYARGEGLTDAQKHLLHTEEEPGEAAFSTTPSWSFTSLPLRSKSEMASRLSACRNTEAGDFSRGRRSVTRPPSSSRRVRARSSGNATGAAATTFPAE